MAAGALPSPCTPWHPWQTFADAGAAAFACAIPWVATVISAARASVRPVSVRRSLTLRAPLSCGHQTAGIFEVFVFDGVDGPVRERPQRIGRIPRCVLRVRRGADDEYMGNIPRLQITIHHTGARVAAHHRPAGVVGRLVLRRRIRALARTPRDLLRTD